jgi:hypothetical protein
MLDFYREKKELSRIAGSGPIEKSAGVLDLKME